MKLSLFEVTMEIHSGEWVIENTTMIAAPTMELAEKKAQSMEFEYNLGMVGREPSTGEEATEDARQKAAEEARKLAEETAKQQAAEEARQKEAEEAKKLKATEEARLKAKEENETKSKVQEDINHLNGIHKDSSTPIAQKRNFIKDHLKDVEDRDEKFQFILNITEKKSIFSSTKEAKWGDDSIKHYCETAAIIKQFSDNNNKMMLDGVVTRYEMQ